MKNLKPIRKYLYPTIVVCLLSFVILPIYPTLKPGSTASAKNSNISMATTVLQTTDVAVSYTVTDLGTVRDSFYIEPLDINNSGEVVGFYRIFPNDGRISRHAFLYSNGVFQDLEALIGIPFSSETDSFAFGINDSGAVVGYYVDLSSSSFPVPSSAFLYKDGVATNLGSFGGLQTVAVAINNNGQIIGNTTTDDTGTEVMYRTFPYSPMNVATDNVGQGVANGINDLGQIVGQCAGGAFRTAPNSPLNPSTDIILPFVINVGNPLPASINNAGHVVGETVDGIAFLYDDDGLTSITNGRAYDINNFGEVVGDVRGGQSIRFIYDRVNGIRDLNSLIPPDSGWNLLRAKAINDHGQIVGFGNLQNVGRHGYLLTPNFATPTGAEITVQSNLVKITYAGIADEGVTSFAPISPASAGTLPGGYELTGIPDTAYEISTTATVAGPIIIGFQVPSITDQAVFDSLRVLHYENGQLVDRTVLPPDSPAPDFAAKTIYARVDSLSPFVIARLATPALSVGPITGPVDPAQVNLAVIVNAGFTDSGTSGPHTAVWGWGDGSTSSGMVTETGGSGSVDGSHIYAAAGVYEVTLTVTNNSGGSSQSVFQFIVIYDPNGGFVTGGGWIYSPAGAYLANPALTGKASFGFVSKYQNGARVPTGNTEFQFKTGNLNFSSTSYEWMVVAGARAQYKGVGTINGSGYYRFMLTAIDGRVNGGGGQDKFRIRIWGDNGSPIYDNQLNAPDNDDPTTMIGGGSIVIHK